MWARAFCLSFLGVLIAACSHSPVINESYENVGAALKRTGFIEGKLWLLDDNGKFFSLSENDSSARQELFPEKVLDFCINHDKLLVLSESEMLEAVTVHQKTADRWDSIEVIPQDGDGLRTLSCSQDSVLVIGARHAIRIKDGKQARINFKVVFLRASKLGPIPTVVHHLGNEFYIGENHGEWGGGLHRVDLRDGTVTTLGEMQGDACNGLLNVDCEVVTGIVNMPGNPGCIVVASGLMHLGESGRLYRVCSDKVSVFYEKQRSSPDASHYDTVPFLNLHRQGNSLWATGSDGVYEIAADGQARRHIVSDYRDIAPFKVSFAIPGIVVVRTDFAKRYDNIEEKDFSLDLVTAK